MDIPKIKDNLARYGTDSLSYFCLQEGRKYFFSSSGNSFLSYKLIGKVALVGANPVGPSEETPLLLQEFLYFIKGASFIPCFIGLSSTTSLQLKSFGFKVHSIGEEASISVATVETNTFKKKVRRARRHVEELGFTSEVYTMSFMPHQYMSQLQAIHNEWVTTKKRVRGFSMTLRRIPQKYDSDCEIVLAVKDGIVYAYLTMMPIYQENSWSIDAIRKKKDVPNGIIEFLILEILETYKKRNVKRISLNFIPFMYKDTKAVSSSLLVHIKSAAYSSLYAFFKCKNLYSFNDKFNPYWETRFLAFPKYTHIPLILPAIVKAELM